MNAFIRGEDRRKAFTGQSPEEHSTAGERGAQGQTVHRVRKELERAVRTLDHVISLCKEKVSEGELLTQSHG